MTNEQEQSSHTPKPQPTPKAAPKRAYEPDKELRTFIAQGGRGGAEQTFNNALRRAAEQAKQEEKSDS